MIIGFDTETRLIGKDNLFPPIVCLTSFDSKTGKEAITAVKPHLGDLQDACYAVIKSPAVKVAANTKFDLGVIVRAFPELLPDIFKEMEEGRVKCVQIREKLLNLADFGDLKYKTMMGIKKPIEYKLSALVKKYLDMDISEDKTSTDAWRTNYEVLEKDPVEKWPTEAVEYAKQDATLAVAVYEAQEERRRQITDRLGHDPLMTEDFRMMADFCLSRVTLHGVAVDPEAKKAIEAMLAEELKPEKLDLLIKEGILLPAVPESPYSNGAKNPDGTPKMKAAVPEKTSRTTLIKYITALGNTNPDIELRYNEPTDTEKAKAEKEGREPQGNLCTDAEWLKEFAELDPVLAQYHHRQKLLKLITTELPRMEYVDDQGQRRTADVVHAVFDVLKETGRTSSFGGDLYPSFNGQNVDPRARKCFVPRPGRLLFSVDYNQMELGTAGQTCLDLFGYSELANKINAGYDTHTYLGAHLAYALDEEFKADVDARGIQDGDLLYAHFKSLAKGTKAQKEFFKTYRTLAKPTGLGYPGGLSPKTFMRLAKAQYGIVCTLERAEMLRDIWLMTYPEFEEYFDYIKKHCKDEYGDGNTFKYITPLGMYRANANYCPTANGLALQSPSAEGAIMGLNEVVRACYDSTRKNELLFGKVFPSIFIHDEIVGEVEDDGKAHLRVEEVGRLMVEAMRIVTPNVEARYGACLMRRWDKAAEPVRDSSGNLVVWEPQEKTTASDEAEGDSV